jgi:hypothetical protein
MAAVDAVAFRVATRDGSARARPAPSRRPGSEDRIGRRLCGFPCDREGGRRTLLPLIAQSGSARLLLGSARSRSRRYPAGTVRRKGVPQADREAWLARGSLPSACERPEGARWGGA